MSTIETENATPMAMPRLMPGSVESSSSDIAVFVKETEVDIVGDELGLVSVIQPALSAP
jgi:hypothetical protein